MKEAISKRIMCDSGVKWGMYLSGGLDSTIIFKLLDSMDIKKFPIYSISFKRKGIDESAYQKLACSNQIQNYHVVEIDDNKLIDNIQNTLHHCEAPLYKFGAVPMYILSKEARKDGTKFVLSGEGADEIFYGYDIYKETLLRKYLSKNNYSEIRLKDIKHVVPPQNRNNKYMMQGYEQHYAASSVNLDDPLFCIRPRIEASSIIYKYFNEELRKEIDRENLDKAIKTHYKAENSLKMLKQCQKVEMDNLLAGYLLSIQGDRVLMANSVEGRYPFLDNELISLAYSIPDYLKLHGYNEKYILKETFSGILPKQIVRRNKFQYSTPGRELIHNKFEFFEEYLTKAACEECGLFDYKLVKDLLEDRNMAITTDMLLVFIVTTHMFYKIFQKWAG
jgi:asparagine synthase (glutamine-hydrolysing)